MAVVDPAASLQEQLRKYENAVVEFTAIDAELQQRRRDARVVEMIRVNRETINAIQRSIDLVRVRLTGMQGVTVRTGSSHPFRAQ